MEEQEPSKLKVAGSSPAGSVILIKDNMSPVLLLDASYRPIKEISWKKAMTLFFQEKIEIIKEYENMWITCRT